MNRLLLCLPALAASACAATGAVPRPFPTPAGGDTEAVAGLPGIETPGRLAGPAPGYAVAGTALSMRGAPYRNGGTDPSGFDCSGLVAYVFAQHGVTLPRTVTELYRTGTSVDTALIAPGDLVFFDTTGQGASHVGIALGGDEFVHAPSASGEVRVERIGSNYWSGRFLGARRVL